MCSATRCLATLLAICQVLFAQLAWCGDFVCKLPNFPPKQNPQTLLPTMARHSSGAKRGSKVQNCSNPGYTNRLIHKLHGSVPLCLCATKGLFGKFSRRVARRADPSLGHRRPPLCHESIWQPPDLSSLTVSHRAHRDSHPHPSVTWASIGVAMATKSAPPVLSAKN